ncbi:MAG: polymerase beta subunit [Pseudomonadota bacterium]|jgi:DNA polymerase-3 subunit beta
MSNRKITRTASVEVADLRDALGAGVGVIARRNTIPILECVLLDVRDGRLALTATDLERETRVAGVSVDALGQDIACAVPGALLHDIVRKLPQAGAATLALDAAHLTIAAGKSRFALAVLEAADFPSTPWATDGAHTFEMASADLAHLLDTCAPAMSAEETRYYLNGIYLAPSPGGEFLRAVATDGHRLMLAEVPLPAGAAGMAGVILPRASIGHMRKLADGAPVQLTVTPARVRIATGDVTLTSKLVDGIFPDYQRVIPAVDPAGTVVEVDAGEMTAALDRVGTVGESNAGVRLDCAEGRVRLTMRDAIGHEAVDEVDASIVGKAIEVGVNPRYLATALGAFGSAARVLVHLNGRAPLRLDADGTSTLAIVMPLRV